MNPTFSAAWVFTCISKKKIEKGRCRGSGRSTCGQSADAHGFSTQGRPPWCALVLWCRRSGLPCDNSPSPSGVQEKQHCVMRTMFKTLSLRLSSEYCCKPSLWGCHQNTVENTLSECVIRILLKTLSLSVSSEHCLKHSLWECHHNTV